MSKDVYEHSVILSTVDRDIFIEATFFGLSSDYVVDVFVRLVLTVDSG
jgi:hypothetical protein